MKIFVCVKQVPDTSGKVAVDENGILIRSSMPTIINPDDMNAMEAALQLKDETGCKVVAVTMGPPPAEGMLRELIAMGADEGILISAREFGGSDTFATSQIIAAAINHVIAEKLDLPQVTYAAEIKKEGNEVTVKRMLEDGYMTIKMQTPCLVTCIKELNAPRYMSVPGIFECYSKPLTILDFEALKDEPLIELDTIGLKGSPTNIFKSFTPPQKGVGVMLEGADKATAADLADRLLKKHVI